MCFLVVVAHSQEHTQPSELLRLSGLQEVVQLSEWPNAENNNKNLAGVVAFSMNE